MPPDTHPVAAAQVFASARHAVVRSTFPDPDSLRLSANFFSHSALSTVWSEVEQSSARRAHAVASVAAGAPDCAAVAVTTGGGAVTTAVESAVG
jgi:hypothetical protein